MAKETDLSTKPKKKKKWWIIIAVVVVIIVAANQGNSDNSGTDSNPKKISGSDNSSDKNKNSASSDKKEEDTTLQTTFVKGDVIKTSDLKVTYLDCGEYTDYNEFSKPADGKKVVFATFEFENISKSDQYVSSFSFSCYADGYDCESYFSSDKESLDATLSSGKKTKGTVLFEVPKDAKEVSIEYDVNYFTSNKLTFVVQ